MCVRYKPSLSLLIMILLELSYSFRMQHFSEVKTQPSFFLFLIEAWFWIQWTDLRRRFLPKQGQPQPHILSRAKVLTPQL